jgi:hypothetical protein
MDHAHAAGSEALVKAVLPRILGKFRFRIRSGVPLWRHGPTPVLFVRAPDARSLVDSSYETEAAC